ncbi:MAG: hypothetical protein JO303_15295 [Caulobacteraceae bacterium]|nr:hypothetical protein [Caulobacteraceae bacterium]
MATILALAASPAGALALAAATLWPALAGQPTWPALSRGRVTSTLTLSLAFGWAVYVVALRVAAPGLA